MPTYNVKCTNEECPDFETVSEIRKKMSEDYPKCPTCNSDVQSVLQASKVVFKGGGWCKPRTRR